MNLHDLIKLVYVQSPYVSDGYALFFCYVYVYFPVQLTKYNFIHNHHLIKLFSSGWFRSEPSR